MPRPTRKGAVVAVAFSAALAGSAACVDLFHSTDFATLCTNDGAACVAESGSAEGSTVDAPTDASLPIDFCTYSSIQAQAHAERACAWMGACKGALEGSAFGTCMVRALAAYDCKLNPSLRPQGATAALWSCLADVASCDAVDACLFGGPSPTCNSDAGATFTACDLGARSTVVECGLVGEGIPPLAVQACVLEGQACATVDDGKAICAGQKQVSCEGGARCDGTSAVSCVNAGGIAADVGFDCAAFGGGRCIADDAGVACAPVDEAASCSGSATITCNDAGAARSCVGGKVVAIDCAAVGMQCEVPPSTLEPLAACKTNPAECSTEDACTSSNILRSCAQGKAFEVSCSSLGLGPCVKQTLPRGPFVTCTKP
jgi:hypothetical protein